MKRAYCVLLLALVACGGSTPKSGDGGLPGAGAAVGSAAPPPVVRGTQMTADAGAPNLPPLKPMDFGENEFTESDRNRDPFRSFASMFIDQAKRPTVNQRTVLLSQYSIDELKLVGIVMGVAGDPYPRAMLVDPTQKGWIVRKGDFIGRPDVVHTGGTNGSDYQLNWRVDRVRDGDIVLTREDPAQPGIAPATRVIPLRTEQEEANPLKTN
jgi:type IV pilus assembly protein PilP